MRVLITGAGGQIGSALTASLRGVAELVLTTRQELDLSRPGSITERLGAFAPNVIVNAGAYTAVDKAESEPELAFAVNAEAVAVLGRWARLHNVPLIHFSTDYVFDGRATMPYEEEHPVNPLSVYGKSKAEGEHRLLDTEAPCLIVRTAWVYSDTGKSFLKTILRLASDKEELRIVDDQIGTPTSSAQVARFIHDVLLTSSKLPALFEKSSHRVHFTADGFTSWHGFACAIVAAMRRYHLPLKAVRVMPISTADYPTSATRPHFSRLSTERLRRVFDFEPGPWEEALEDEFMSLLPRLSES